jgi:hypothetical protein
MNADNHLYYRFSEKRGSCHYLLGYSESVIVNQSAHIARHNARMCTFVHSITYFCTSCEPCAVLNNILQIVCQSAHTACTCALYVCALCARTVHNNQQSSGNASISFFGCCIFLYIKCCSTGRQVSFHYSFVST